MEDWLRKNAMGDKDYDCETMKMYVTRASGKKLPCRAEVPK